MKALIVILAVVFFFCSPEKELQVHSEYWTLVEKKPTSRYFDDDFTWLIFADKNGLRYWYRAANNIADTYSIGSTTLAMVK